jgi:hypothetical protein
VPEPLLPGPELCANTNGAVTRITARAATTVLLNLLNITMLLQLSWLCVLISLFELCVHLRYTQHGHRTYGAKGGNSYATDIRKTALPQDDVSHSKYPWERSACLLLRPMSALLWNITLTVRAFFLEFRKFQGIESNALM